MIRVVGYLDVQKLENLSVPANSGIVFEAPTDFLTFSFGVGRFGSLRT